MISTSDDLFMISVIVVALLAVAVALSLRITCNYIHRYYILLISRNA